MQVAAGNPEPTFVRPQVSPHGVQLDPGTVPGLNDLLEAAVDLVDLREHGSLVRTLGTQRGWLSACDGCGGRRCEQRDDQRDEESCSHEPMEPGGEGLARP